MGLRFDRIESGYVYAFTGDPALRRAVENEPPPRPSDLALRADELLGAFPAGLDSFRADFIAAHLRALACAGPKFAGEPVGFVDEVRAYFDVAIAKGDTDRYFQAHARLADALGGSGPLADRMQAYRIADEIAPQRLSQCIDAFSSALRDRVRADYPLPDGELVEYEAVTDKPWASITTSVTIGRAWPSMPTSSCRCRTCRAWLLTNRIRVTTPSTAASRPVSSNAVARASRRSSSSTRRSA